LKGQGGVDKNDVRVIAGPLMDMHTLRGICEILDTGRAMISFIRAEKATGALDEGETGEAAACIPASTRSL